MARTGQVEYIADLLERKDLTRDELAELAGEPSWADYERLPDDTASDAIEWLKDYRPGE